MRVSKLITGFPDTMGLEEALSPTMAMTIKHLQRHHKKLLKNLVGGISRKKVDPLLLELKLNKEETPSKTVGSQGSEGKGLL